MPATPTMSSPSLPVTGKRDQPVSSRSTRAETGADTWLVPGHLRLDELDTATELRLASSDEYSTISGLILEDLGRTAVVGDEVHVEARREVVSDGHHGSEGDGPDVRAGDADEDAQPSGDHEAPGRPGDPSEHDREHDREHRYLPVSVRLTVEAVERHVPSAVRVEVLDLMSDLEALEIDTGSDPDGSDAARGDATDRTAGSRTEAGR